MFRLSGIVSRPAKSKNLKSDQQNKNKNKNKKQKPEK
jgi:hypothetical protein